MKQKDLVLILVIAVISAIVSFLVSGWIFGGPTNKQQKGEVVDVLTSDFTAPSSKYFNATSVDPTQLIQIGTSTNPDPFSGVQ